MLPGKWVRTLTVRDQLARYAPEDELAMDLLVAEAVLEFGTSLREAGDAAMQWARERGVAPVE